MMHGLRLALTASASLATARPQRNRRRYGPRRGIRVLALHAEDTHPLDRFRRWVEWCAEQMPLASPDALDDGVHGDSDALLFTMDDGDARTYRAVEWMASVGIHIIYFVVPSYIGRTATEYLAFHRCRGVQAFNIASGPDRSVARGFERSELLEIERMGHRIGAHNDAHRSLGRLGSSDAAYEIDGAIDGLSELLQHPVDDFAWAFGTMASMTPGALAMIRRRCRRVYSCVRGLNVPHVTPRVILRDIVSLDVPAIFTRARLHCGFDHRDERGRRELIRLTGRLRAATA